MQGSGSFGILPLDQDDTEGDGMDAAARKFLFLVSDRSGATASHLLTASFYQFGQQGDDITVQVFSNVRTSRMLSRIVCLAQRINALVCFTLADRNARRMLVHHCEELGAPTQTATLTSRTQLSASL